MKRVFEPIQARSQSSVQDTPGSPGTTSVSDYAVDLQTQASSSGWKEQAQYDTFLNGLSEEVKDELLTRELPESLDDLVRITIRVDTPLQERHRLRAQGGSCGASAGVPRSSPEVIAHSTEPPAANPEPEPIQLGWTRLTREERDRMMPS